MIRVDTVAFNHNPMTAIGNGVNIRKNATAWVTVPEWRRGFCVNPEDSPAAYAIAQNQGNAVTIIASLSSTDPEVTQAEVRARDNVVFPPPPAGCLGWLIAILQAIFRVLFGNVLGEVAARSVSFANGTSGPVTFNLTGVKLASAGIGVHTTEWRWQYRLPRKKAWQDIQITRHRIYTVLDVPTLPWQQQPYGQANVQLPWTDVLDYACRWALGATTFDAAAAGVTGNIYNLGPQVITYDCPNGGSPYYSLGNFDCTAFVDRLKGGVGNGIYVNCSDCATLTSSFSNILGCDLWQSRMGYGFALNEILAIGSNIWQTPCKGIDGWMGSFSYHEVAWKGGSTANDNVFDACLQVDGDADPTSPPHAPLLPTNLRFGNPGDLEYRDRLATPTGRATCNPQPQTRTRRLVV